MTKTEAGYTQGLLHNPTYEDICSGTTNHSEVVRVQYDLKEEGSYEALLDAFWQRHDPTTLNRQVGNLKIFLVLFGFVNSWILCLLNSDMVLDWVAVQIALAGLIAD